MTNGFWHSFAGAVSVSIALFASSCTSDGGGDRGGGNLPRIGELRPRGGQIDDPYPARPQPLPLAAYQRITLPLATRLEELWALTSTDPLADEKVALWRANGMRVGVMKAEQVKAMQEAMVGYTGVETGYFTMSKYHSPLYTAPPLGGPVAIELVDQSDVPRRVVLNGGRVRFLVKLRHDENDRAMLDIVPQHHLRKRRLTPRSPMETVLDGVVFESLKLTAELRADRLVLIGLELPPPPGDGSQEESTEGEPTAKPVGSADTNGNDSGSSPGFSTSDDKGAQTAMPARRPKIDVPFHLGRVLLTASRARRPLQMVFVFGLYILPPANVAGDVDRETRQMLRKLRGRRHGRPGR